MNLSHARTQLHNTLLSPADSICLTAVHIVYFLTKVSDAVPCSSSVMSGFCIVVCL